MGYGNLAYKLEDYQTTKTTTTKPEVQSVQTAKKTKLNYRLIFMVLVLSVSAYFMISKHVMVDETQREIQRLEKELAQLEAYTSQKVFELEQSVDLATVEEIATTKLKMQRPEKYQTVYVNIKKDDVTEITAGEVEGVKNRVTDTADSLKRNILGIFKLSWK